MGREARTFVQRIRYHWELQEVISELKSRWNDAQHAERSIIVRILDGAKEKRKRVKVNFLAEAKN